MNRSESIGKISAALVKAQSEMSNATKGSANPFFKSKYADLNSIREACLPALTANGLSVIQPTVVIDGKNYVETLILHESGEYLGGYTEIVCSKKDNAQDFGAGTTYARRFGLQALLCIGAEDDDGETVVGRGKSTVSYNKSEAKTATQVSTVTEKVNGSVTAGAANIVSAEVTPVKKGGFGVKKTETVANTETDEGWS